VQRFATGTTDRRPRGLAIALEREAGEILDGIEGHFPRTLSLEDQGRFAIGYYHQRSERFRRKTASNDTSDLADGFIEETTEEEPA
jgi:CRISPR-associated protein Csd1